MIAGMSIMLYSLEPRNTSSSILSLILWIHTESNHQQATTSPWGYVVLDEDEKNCANDSLVGQSRCVESY